jgi:hypothetical protein
MGTGQLSGCASAEPCLPTSKKIVSKILKKINCFFIIKRENKPDDFRYFFVKWIFKRAVSWYAFKVKKISFATGAKRKTKNNLNK